MGTLSPRSIPKEIIEVCRKLADAGFEAYLVGGAVRDHLRLDKEQAFAKDFDIATSARPEQVIQLFGRKNTVPTGIRHGTVTILVPHPGGDDGRRGHREHVEITTFRGEGSYSDGRRPDQVVFLLDLREDLQRRDFTINAIAYDPLGDRLIDPFFGIRDLRDRLIRAVGDPDARFAEDGLRTMRAVRFAAQLEFVIEPATFQAIGKALPTLRKVSRERIRDELLKLLGARQPSLGLALMRQSGLLNEVLPELPAAGTDAFALVDALPPDPLLRLGALLLPLPPSLRTTAALAPLLERFKLSIKDRDRLRLLLSAPDVPYQAGWSAAQVRRFLAATPPALRQDLEELHRARCAVLDQAERFEAPGTLGELFRRAREELAAAPPLTIGQLALSGEDVMRVLGVPRSPQVGAALRYLLEQVLEEPARNTPERLRELLIHHRP